MILLLASCGTILKDDKLTLERMSYTGNKLRLDGYYYNINNHTNTISSSYFFYNNGIVLYGGGWPYEDMFEGLESNFISESWNESIKGKKQKWDIFQIEGYKISFERYYPSSGDGLPAGIRSGEILNDSTFIINKFYRPKTGEERELSIEVYHFRQFSPKPDSTNIFIK